VTVPAFILDAVQPWADLYANSAPVSIAVTFLHLAAMMVGGGAAIAADWQVIARRPFSLVEEARLLERTHRVVIPAFLIIAITGAAMAGSDLGVFATSGVFATKLVLATLLAVNGGWLMVLGRSDSRSTRRLQMASAVSVVLWLATLLAGCWLQVAA
jgi:hypothetical protein